MYSKKKIVRNVILVAAILLILLILIFSLGDIKKIGYVLINQTNYWMILLCVVIVLVYCVLYQISLVILTKYKYKGISFKDSFYVSGSEFFFNAITPFSSGGQPFQAYAFKRRGMKLSDSTSVLLLNFLAYQVVLNLFSIICLAIYYNRLAEQIDSIIWFVIVGFSINIIVMIFLILLGTTKFMGKLLIWLMDLLSKIKFLKKLLANKKPAFEVYVAEMQGAFKEIAKSKRIWFSAVISKIFALLVYYSIPYFVFLAIGIDLNFKDIFYIIAMTSFALTISIWVPTPGASGGAELAFTTLFTGLIIGYGDPDNIALSGMLVWRLLTYYFLIIYGFIMYILFERGNKNEDRSLY